MAICLRTRQRQKFLQASWLRTDVTQRVTIVAGCHGSGIIKTTQQWNRVAS